MTWGELFSGGAACCILLWSGLRAWTRRNEGWNRRRAVLRLALTPVNTGLLGLPCKTCM